jgi:ligand-binding sensor domain-containing protein
MYRKKIAAVIGWILVSFSGTAQTPFFQSYFLQKKNEPIHVNVIFQDKTGFMWFGTSNGLFRFDGLAYRRFGRADSLADENITALAEDSLRHLWVGHKNGRIDYLDGTSVRKFNPREGLSSQPISDMLFDRRGNLWFATLNDGLYYYTEDRLFRLDESEGMPDLFVYDILEDSKGTLWAGTDGGVVQCTLKGKKATLKVLNASNGLPDNIVKKLALDETGTVWMATEDAGMVRFNPVSHAYAPLLKGGWPYGTITDFLIHGNQVWISSASGLVVIGRRTEQARVYQSNAVPALGSINTLRQDREGNIWVGSKTGVSRALGDYVRFIDSFEPSTDPNVTALAVDRQDNIWFANSAGLFKRSVAPSGVVTTTRQLVNTPYQKYTVISLFRDAAGYIWVGLYGEGALRINPVNGQLRYLNKELRNGNVLNITGKGNEVWLATLGGASQITLSGEKLSVRNYGTGEGLVSDYIYQIFIDSKDRIWFATDGKGVGMKDATGFHHFQDGLTSRIVYSIAEDGLHRIWVNVPGEGLYTLEGNTFKILHARTPLRDTNISGLTSDRFGNLVVINDLGIDLYDVRKNKIRYLGDEVGLRDRAPNLNALAKDSLARLIFGTNAGIVVYSSRNDTSIINPVPLISGIKIFDTPADPATPSFHYQQNTLTFSYLGFWYQNPADLYFRYQLDNHDREWINSRDRSATYSSLPPGDYTFHVKVSDTEDFSEAKETSLKIVILPPFWRTTWFLILCVVAVAAAVYAIVRFREQSLIREKKILEERVMERTVEIQQKTDEIQAQNEEIQSQAEEIKGINEHLELLVKQRTEELVRKNKALEEYAFINAHNLRAPVASVLGLINLVCKLDLDEESREIIEHLRASAERLDAIVSSITQAIEKGD